LKEIKFLFLIFFISLAHAQPSWEEGTKQKDEDLTNPKINGSEIAEPNESMPDKTEEPEVDPQNESLPEESED
jgi:hypothetical protein